MLATLAVACGLSVGAADLPKPVMDWDFSRKLEDYRPTNYGDRLAIAIVERDGARVLSIRNEKPPLPKGREPDTSFALESGTFDVTAGAEFAVRVKARGTVRMQVPTPPPCVRWLDAGGKPLTTVDAEGRTVPLAYDFRFETGSDRWQETLVRSVVPTEAKRAKLLLRCDQPNIISGKWLEVAGISYYERKDGCGWDFGDLEAPEVARVTPSPCADLKAAVTFRVTDRSALDRASFRCLLDGVDVTAQVVWNGNSFSYRPPAPWAWHSFHEFLISLADEKGNRFDESRFVFFGEPCRGHAKGAVRDDGMLLVDGRPFFPISIASVRECPLNGHDVAKGVADLKAAGFNLGHSYSVARDPAFLRAAAKYGFKLWTGAVDAPKLDTWFVEKGRHDPTHLAWYLGDDTWDNTTPEQLRDRHEAVTAIDGMRLTCQADPIRSDWAKDHYQDYVNYTDVFMPEIYPLHGDEKDAACVAQTIRDMDRAFADIAKYGDGRPRAVWPIIQHFKGWGWRKFPTADQLNAMSFAALIHGGKGITWYTYGGYCNESKKQFNYGVTSSAEVWGALTNVSRRISSVAPVLLEGPCAQPPVPEVVGGPKADALGQPSVTCLAKRHDGALWLFAVNATDKDVTARLTPGAWGRGEVLWENRTVEIKDGGFTDGFRPYAVHVYRID